MGGSFFSFFLLYRYHSHKLLSYSSSMQAAVKHLSRAEIRVIRSAPEDTCVRAWLNRGHAKTKRSRRPRVARFSISPLFFLVILLHGLCLYDLLHALYQCGTCIWKCGDGRGESPQRINTHSLTQSSRSHRGHQEEALGLPRVDNRRLAIRVGAGCGFSGSSVGVNGGARPGASSPAEAAARQQKRM